VVEVAVEEVGVVPAVKVEAQMAVVGVVEEAVEEVGVKEL
jgi:hypothetical protein